MTQNRIPWYSNGNCPTSRLIVFNRGFTAGEGDWEHRLPRATLRRWRSLVARAYRRTGRILTISTGWGTDRPYNIQVMAKQKYGKYAATPGYSSHGMVFEGQQTAAIDASNWSWVYDGNYAAWQQDVAAEGFTRLPNGYQQEGEYHHIIDWNPWDDEPEFGGAPAGLDVTEFSTTEQDDTEMISKETQDWFNSWFDSIRADIRVPGEPYSWAQANNNELASIVPLVKETQARIRGTEARGDVLQIILEKLGQPITAEVDAASFAKELAPLLAPYLDELDDADLAKIAKASADEQDRRARERLAAEPVK